MLKILFVQNVAAEQLGVMSIAAIARQRGHQLKTIFGHNQHILQTAQSFKPDIVGFSVMTGFQNRWIGIARDLKKALDPKPLIIFGGPHPTFFPQVVLEESVDVACRGEGEGAFADLLDVVEAGESSFEGIPNLVVKKGDGYEAAPLRPLEDLDLLPFPDRQISFEHQFIRKDPSLYFIAGRGCPFSCSFCYAIQMRKLCKGLGPPCRLRSVDNLIEEIDLVHRQWKNKILYFADDTFCLNSKWLNTFLETYARRFRTPFFCQIRADQTTKELAQALKDAGCYRVSFGVESGVEHIRDEVLNKNVSDERIREAAAILRKVGLPFQTTNMMGLPNETLDDALSTLELNIEIGADVAWMSLFQPYPGTALGEKTFKEGLIDRFPDDEATANAHTGSILKQKDIDKIVRLHKFVYLAVKYPSSLPLIKKLVNYDCPKLYMAIHRLTYFFFYFCRQRNLNLTRIVAEALAAIKYY